ncbi:uncharacterized protein [Typha angustifolia]|uniref:uncharacterized protein n=1 Tax=Typha angustifolia TaxID=59011 RepID=UPI003C2FB12D
MGSSKLVIIITIIFFFFSLCNSAKIGALSSFLRARRSNPLPNSPGVTFRKEYFTQELDHFNFNPQSFVTFQQKYLVNDTYWGGKSAPIFVYTGNEGDIELFAENTGFMWEIAPQFQAMLVFIEHRYYGESIPFGGRNEAYSNASTLGYLTSTQAIADYATLIVDLKKNLSSGGHVVVFGGSYGGMLAAWFRLKYPHIAVGALASSAPILGFDDIASPNFFYDIVSNDYKSESENCYEVIKNSWEKMEKALYEKGGPEKLEKEFKMCADDEYGVEGMVENALVYAAMTDYPTVSNFLTPLPANPVKKMCEAIDNPTTGTDTFARLYGAMNIYYNYTGDLKCLTAYANDTYGMSEGWNWQACTEILLSDGISNHSMFPSYPYNATDRALSCQHAYGVPPRRHWMSTEFGGLDIKRALKHFASNIIFFNGLRDPWSGGGVLKSLSKSLIAIVAPKGAHHVDLRFSTKEDPQWLKEVREREIQIISKWLRE